MFVNAKFVTQRTPTGRWADGMCSRNEMREEILHSKIRHGFLLDLVYATRANIKCRLEIALSTLEPSGIYLISECK